MANEQAPPLKTAQTMMAKAKPAAAAGEIMPEAVPVRDQQDGGESGDGAAKPKFAKSLTERIKSGKRENDPNENTL